MMSTTSSSSTCSSTSTAAPGATAMALLTMLSLAPRPASSVTAATTSSANNLAFVLPPCPSRGLSSSSRICPRGVPAATHHLEESSGRSCRRRAATTTPSFVPMRAARIGDHDEGDDAPPSSAFGSTRRRAGKGKMKKKGMSTSALSISPSSTSIENEDVSPRRRPMAMRVTPASVGGGSKRKNNGRRKKGTTTTTALGATPETEAEMPPPSASASSVESSSTDGRRDGSESKTKVNKGGENKSPSPPSNSSPLSFREDVLDHRLLTKEEELDLAAMIHRGAEMRERMTSLVEEKMLQLADDSDAELSSVQGGGGDVDGCLGVVGDLDVELLSDLPYLAESRVAIRRAEVGRNKAEAEVDEDGSATTEFLFDRITNPPVTYREESLLTELDCVSTLDLPGGRSELRRILRDASDARQTLVKCNMKLVVSIAKKWLSRGIDSDRHDAYDGGWDRPSLDELVQEGVLGLNRAAEKYDPQRGVRFSTYATHWISAYVRTCVRDHLTSCLKVPYALHEIKRAYKAIMRNAHLEAPHDPLPTREEVARQIGVSPERLASALAVTRTVLSIDAPIFGGGSGGSGGGGTVGAKGSGAGGDTAGVDQQLTLADALRSTETSPEEFVDLSFLRQCLENAMAAELSPHERDVVRLRLGLDDGHSKTAREVVDVCGGAISMADVRTAERRAYKKLRSPNAVHTYDLLSFLDPADVDYEMYSRPRF